MKSSRTRVSGATVRPATRRTGRRVATRQRHVGPVPLWVLGGVAVLVVLVVAIAALNSTSPPGTPGRNYDVGEPGVGELAPDFSLPDAKGGTFQLSDQRGKDILLYFHEGLMCAPCWQQIEDIERDIAQFTDTGVDQVVAISIDGLAAQARHAQQRGITLPVLADEDRRVSQAYDALSYGMMNGATPGHSFVLVGPDGVIRWRADYGGPPDYTMYVPNGEILSELGPVIDADSG